MRRCSATSRESSPAAEAACTSQHTLQTHCSQCEKQPATAGCEVYTSCTATKQASLSLHCSQARLCIFSLHSAMCRSLCVHVHRIRRVFHAKAFVLDACVRFCPRGACLLASSADELHLLPALDLVRRAAVAEVAGRPALAALLVVEPLTRCLLDRTLPQNQRRALGSHLVRAT